MTLKEFFDCLEFAANEPFQDHNLINGDIAYDTACNALTNIKALIMEYKAEKPQATTQG
jgi:hypothetical protein